MDIEFCAGFFFLSFNHHRGIYIKVYIRKKRVCCFRLSVFVQYTEGTKHLDDIKKLKFFNLQKIPMPHKQHYFIKLNAMESSTLFG